jgi:hypothetical protein
MNLSDMRRNLNAGYTFVSADFAQIELRVLAHVTSMFVFAFPKAIGYVLTADAFIDPAHRRCRVDCNVQANAH